MKLIDGAIYKLKVGLPAFKFNSDESEGGKIIKMESNVYYDQESDGGYIFGCFPPYAEFYCRVPLEYLDEHLELVDEINRVPRKNLTT